MLNSLRALAKTSAVASSGTDAVKFGRVSFHEIRGNRMMLRQWGPESGPLILLRTGLSLNSLSFSDLAQKLASKGYHVVAPDMRGRNLSPSSGPGTYGLENHALDGVEIINKLNTSGRKVSIVGLSYGGLTAMHEARMLGDQLDKLVLLDILGVPEMGAVGVISRSVDRLERDYASPEEYVDIQRSSGRIVPFTETWRRHFAEELYQLPNGRWRSRSDSAAIQEDTFSASTQFPHAYWGFLPKNTLLVKAGIPLSELLGNVVSDFDISLMKRGIPAAPVMASALGQAKDAWDGLAKAGVPFANMFARTAETWQENWTRLARTDFKQITVAANHYSVVTDPSSVKAISDFIGPAKR